MLESLFRTAKQTIPVAHADATAVAPRPLLPAARLEKAPANAHHERYLEEYAEIAAVIGVTPPDLQIEEFKALLVKLDYPIFSLSEVIAYMDDKAAKESKEKAGWEWRPLRAKDDRSMAFGRPASRIDPYRNTEIAKPASDYYSGPARGRRTQHVGNRDPGAVYWHEFDVKGQHAVYDRTIPLHALRRVAAIEKEFKGDVAFFVCDYALMPEIRYPDPFLMAVIPNVNVTNGTGRFIIDFWDEPGFGIAQMLK